MYHFGCRERLNLGERELGLLICFTKKVSEKLMKDFDAFNSSKFPVFQRRGKGFEILNADAQKKDLARKANEGNTTLKSNSTVDTFN